MTHEYAMRDNPYSEHLTVPTSKKFRPGVRQIVALHYRPGDSPSLL